MKIERTKNASRNIVFGILLKVYQLAVPFAMRTAMIYFMGIQYLGLNSLFASILEVLNLAELGVGSAMVFSMYKPIAEDDKSKICALMKLYRTMYRIIGLVICVVGLALTPAIPKLIHSDVPPDMNVYFLYLMNLGTTVISYWLFAYKNCLFGAFQRGDVTSKISIATTTVQYAIQFFIVIAVKNYYWYLIAAMGTQIMNNIITAIAASKRWPDYRPVGKLDKEEQRSIMNRVKDLFTAKVGGTIVNSADTIVISAFLGLSMLAIYQNYFYVVTALIGFVNIIFGATTAGIGNSLIVETKEKNFRDLSKFTFLIAWVTGWSGCTMFCLFQPFIEIWVGKGLQLKFFAVVCFVIYYYVYLINQLLCTYKDAGGIWHADRFRPLVTAGVNLALNLLTVKHLGVYGVLLSTVVSTLLVGLPWLLHNLFTTLFDKKYLAGYLKHLVIYTVIAAAVCAGTYGICTLIPLERWGALIVRLAVCIVMPNLIFFIFYRKMPEFGPSVEIVDRMTHGKLHLKKLVH